MSGPSPPSATNTKPTATVPESAASLDFIRNLIKADQETGRFDRRVVTRFPPEPNGFLHIGHAKAVFLNMGLARDFGGHFNLRFDDTNPQKEAPEYVEAAQCDLKWLGVIWDGEPKFASSYFEQLYVWATELIKKDKAYVDDLSADQIREYRGTLTEPGRNSPFRDRSADENLRLFSAMREGEFPDRAKVLRAKIDMASPNLNLRDPVLYRILRAIHHQTKDEWCIYPTYDWAHGQSDSIEGITHSICSLEFADHNPLYQWFLQALDIYAPVQIEFARLELNYTITSKRVINTFVQQALLDGWDDPRMSTLAGLRRRGVPASAIRELCRQVGVAKTNSMVETQLFDHCVRQALNPVALRRMGVLNPVKLVVTNYPIDQQEEFLAVNNPENENAGVRPISFSRELYIERDDYQDNPHRKFHRLAIGKKVRLRYAYIVTCTNVIRDDAGAVVEVHCTYDPATRGGSTPDGSKVRGTIHWVDCRTALDAEVQLIDHLFLDPNVVHMKADEAIEVFNPDSRVVIRGVKVEPAAARDARYDTIQLERQGYFRQDCKSAPRHISLIRTVALRDSWKKIASKAG